jgi:hypothetical protein
MRDSRMVTSNYTASLSDVSGSVEADNTVIKGVI